MRLKEGACPIILSSVVLLLLLIIILSNVLVVTAAQNVSPTKTYVYNTNYGSVTKSGVDTAANIVTSTVYGLDGALSFGQSMVTLASATSDSTEIPSSPITQNPTIITILIGAASGIIAGIVLNHYLGVLGKLKKILRPWIKNIGESLKQERPTYKIIGYVFIFVLLINMLLVSTYIGLREDTDFLQSQPPYPNNPSSNDPSTNDPSVESVNENDITSDNTTTDFSESEETITPSSTNYVNVDIVLKDGGVIKDAKLHFVEWGWGPYNVTTFKFTDNLDNIKNEENVPNNITREFKLSVIKRMDFIDLNGKDLRDLDSVKSWYYHFDLGDVRKVDITLRNGQIYENIYILQIGVYDTSIESGTIQDSQIKAIVFR